MNSFKFFIALVVLAMAFASNKKTETKTVAAKSSSSSSKSVAMKSAKGASALNTMDEDALSFIQNYKSAIYGFCMTIHTTDATACQTVAKQLCGKNADPVVCPTTVSGEYDDSTGICTLCKSDVV